MTELRSSSAVYGLPLAFDIKLDAKVQQYGPTLPGSAILEDVPENSLPDFTFFAPPGTVERRYVMALMLRALKPGASFTVLAPVKKGGNRIADELKSFGCAFSERSDQHYKIYAGTKPEVLQNITAAIADGAPRIVKEAGGWSQPGIFSWDRTDPGSAMLAKLMPDFTGIGADLGCGNGFLARKILASQQVTRLTLLDIDRRALDCARLNITDPRAVFCWADMRQPQSLSGLDFIVMNPPFHSDGLQEHALGQMFIERAASMLRAGGTCWMVANRHLPYEAYLQKNFTSMTRIHEADGFKIYEATR